MTSPAITTGTCRSSVPSDASWWPGAACGRVSGYWTSPRDAGRSPLPEICAEAGFTDIERHTVRAGFAVRDPQHFWDWNMSHGFRGYVESLGPRLADELRARMLAGLERVHASGGITLDWTVTFTRARKT